MSISHAIGEPSLTDNFYPVTLPFIRGGINFRWRRAEGHPSRPHVDTNRQEIKIDAAAGDDRGAGEGKSRFS